MNDFPKRLRHLRERMRPVKSMTITSQLMGLSPDALRRYERGEREPKLRELKKIAKYYQIGLDEFCWDEMERDE